MSRKPVPSSRRKVHLMTEPGRTACGRSTDDPAVSGYTTTDPDAVTCGACHAGGPPGAVPAQTSGRPHSGIVIHVSEPPPAPPPHPCAVGRHRPAYLAAGGIACGYCGVRLR